MVSVVVLAGYNEKEREDYKKRIEEAYDGEDLIDPNKALIEFDTLVDREILKKPIIQFTLEKLEKISSIEDIVIVGDSSSLEDKLGSFIRSSEKEYELIEQTEEINEETIKSLGLSKKIETNSLCGNTAKGYAATKSYKKRDHALYLACDSPLTLTKTIESFAEISKKHKPEASIVYALACMEDTTPPSLRILKFFYRFMYDRKRVFPRKYLFLINDTEFKHPNTYKKLLDQREGFRVSSMVFVNPFNVDLNVLNDFYSMRKWLSKEVRDKMKYFLNQKGIKASRVFGDYFKGKFTITDFEDIASKTICRKGSMCKIIPVNDMGSSYDLDTIPDKKYFERILLTEYHKYP